MQKTIKTKSGMTLILPTPEEDAAITAAALSDPDAHPVYLAPEKYRLVGRPKAAVTKERITIRLSPEVVSHYRATGKGWQTRIDQDLRKLIAEAQPA